jgi:DNA-binding transcriptional LysR family regulator
VDIKLLEDFVCLATLHSFTAASRERCITQSALSKRIKSLEGWFGTELIKRDSSSFNLTPQGRVFVPEAKLILRRLYNARESAQASIANDQIEISVAAQNSIAQTLFLGWAKRLESRLGKTYVRLVSEKLSDCIDLLNEGHVNYLFCYANEAYNLPIDKNKFTYTTVGRELLIPVTVPNPDKTPLFSLPGSAEDPIPFAAYSHESLFGKVVAQLIQKKAHQCFLSRRYENAYSHMLKSMVRESLGLAWLPKSSIINELEQGLLCRAGDEHWDIEFDIRLYYHHAAASSSEIAVLETSLEMAAELSKDPI